ncbi:hypothetical protein AYI68_g6721 [Smittium mucronatum]|uniref:Uncharacterized protein n=1 Tax=Smittium mucronatum TaxID=133383 RepID=A0A1R0GQQ7_9FUNG|nr:hypothetical protein AYI68_g6721 [Smittium mucronatum]
MYANLFAKTLANIFSNVETGTTMLVDIISEMYPVSQIFLKIFKIILSIFEVGKVSDLTNFHTSLGIPSTPEALLFGIYFRAEVISDQFIGSSHSGKGSMSKFSIGSHLSVVLLFPVISIARFLK